MRKSKKNSDGIKIKGFYKLQVNTHDEKGNIVKSKTTDWIQNQVTNDGIDQYLCRALGSISGSKYVTYAALGTGTAPGATATTLDGEITDASNMRCAVTPTTIASKTVQFAFTLNSNIITAAKTIQNVGLFQQSNTNTATIFAGNTYTTSALATNQSVNGTYQIRFS